MKTILVLLVDNGEHTDGIARAVKSVGDHVDVIDWTVRVDVPDDARRDYVFRHIPWLANVPPGAPDIIVGAPSKDSLA